MEFLKWEHFN